MLIFIGSTIDPFTAYRSKVIFPKTAAMKRDKIMVGRRRLDVQQPRIANCEVFELLTAHKGLLLQEAYPIIMFISGKLSH